jgi:hypothetical protein
MLSQPEKVATEPRKKKRDEKRAKQQDDQESPREKKRNKSQTQDLLKNVANFTTFLEKHGKGFFFIGTEHRTGFVRLGDSDIHLSENALLTWKNDGYYAGKKKFGSPAETWHSAPRTIQALEANFYQVRASNFEPNPLITFAAELEKQIYENRLLTFNHAPVDLNFIPVPRYAHPGAWHRLPTPL